MLLALKLAYCVLYQIPNLNSRKKQSTVTNTYTAREKENTETAETDRFIERDTQSMYVLPYI